MRPWPQNPGKVTEAAAFSQSSRGLARNRAAGHQTRMQLDRAAAPVASTSPPLAQAWGPLRWQLLVCALSQGSVTVQEVGLWK